MKTYDIINIVTLHVLLLAGTPSSQTISGWLFSFLSGFLYSQTERSKFLLITAAGEAVVSLLWDTYHHSGLAEGGALEWRMLAHSMVKNLVGGAIALSLGLRWLTEFKYINDLIAKAYKKIDDGEKKKDSNKELKEDSEEEKIKGKKTTEDSSATDADSVAQRTRKRAKKTKY